MGEWIENLSYLMIYDRSWSWSVMAIFYMALTLIVRNWFLRGITKRARELKHRWYHDFKDAYLKRAVTGWIFYLISLVLVILVWIRPAFFPLKPLHIAALVFAFFSYIVCLLLHLQALAVAAVVTLRRLESK